MTSVNTTGQASLAGFAEKMFLFLLLLTLGTPGHCECWCGNDELRIRSMIQSASAVVYAQVTEATSAETILRYKHEQQSWWRRLLRGKKAHLFPLSFSILVDRTLVGTVPSNVLRFNYVSSLGEDADVYRRGEQGVFLIKDSRPDGTADLFKYFCRCSFVSDQDQKLMQLLLEEINPG